MKDMTRKKVENNQQNDSKEEFSEDKVNDENIDVARLIEEMMEDSR
jgi:hypothetical protein